VRFSTLDAWLRWQETLHPSAIDLGLERVAEVAARLHVLPLAPTIFTVGGTNGKGSTVAMLEAILRAAGYRVGAYTSPHLLRYNERIRLQTVPVGDDVLCDAFTRVDQARGDISLTYFEFGTLAAMDIFRRAELDVVILEVGLGGRLDAVNIVDADVSIITSIDLDHTQWLGDTRDAIATEKFGIARRGRPLVLGDTEPPANTDELAAAHGAKLWRLQKDFGYRGRSVGWEFWSSDSVRSGLPAPSLRGLHQWRNASCVLMALACRQSELPVSLEAIRIGLQQAYVPGRFEVSQKNGITLILDVAHNPHACRQLAENVRAFPRLGTTRAVVSMLADKDITASLAPLASVIDTWYFGGLDVTRGCTSAAMADFASRAGVATSAMSTFTTVADAYRAAAMAAQAQDVIVVFGSFYTVAEVMQLREQES
jgi:dihydrofolate synthase/folylpolyglutamate synthase